MPAKEFDAPGILPGFVIPICGSVSYRSVILILKAIFINRYGLLAAVSKQPSNLHFDRNGMGHFGYKFHAMYAHEVAQPIYCQRVFNVARLALSLSFRLISQDALRYPPPLSDFNDNLSCWAPFPNFFTFLYWSGPEAGKTCTLNENAELKRIPVEVPFHAESRCGLTN